MICRYCETPIEEGKEVMTTAYWWTNDKKTSYSDGRYPCHSECKVKGEAEEAYECQKIDADCNDCKYFKREKQVEITELDMNDFPMSKVVHKELLFPPMGKVWIGTCLKFNKPTIACPKMATGHPCFEHRKD